jgi:hypothetical protein
MATYAHIYCKTCKEEIFLGKWVRSDDDRGVGFWLGDLDPEGKINAAPLGRKVLRFLATHINHEVVVASDDGGLADSLDESGEYRNMDDEYEAEATDT